MIQPSLRKFFSSQSIEIQFPVGDRHQNTNRNVLKEFDLIYGKSRRRVFHPYAVNEQRP
ncbi:MAG: hypothetical protein QM772_08480 [Ottowia sp.]|uniref:hypothetical protein n=1 Tax=Ottowia sp. TaxID=1898956 RepID=UPI0039E254FE